MLRRILTGGIIVFLVWIDNALRAQPNSGDWTVFEQVSKMDNTTKVTLHASSEDRLVTLIVGCERQRIQLAFVSDRGFRLGDINCNQLANGVEGWLGGRRCVTQSIVRWRFEPVSVLSSYWLETTDSSKGVRFDTLWKKQIGLMADSETVRVEFTAIDGEIIEKEIPIKGLRESLPSLASAGCRITIKSKRKR